MLPIKKEDYDPQQRLYDGSCSVYECLAVMCCGICTAKPKNTSEKVALIAMTTVGGAGIGALAGNQIGKPGEGAALLAGIGLGLGTMKVIYESCRESRDRGPDQQGMEG